MFDFDDENPVPCFFCGLPVAVGGEGYEGRVIGKKAICTGCLSKLSEALEWAK